MTPRLSLPLLLLAGLLGNTTPEVQEPFQISVNVHLVMLNTSVRDRKGLAVSDLSEQAFEVYEDGVKQTIRLFKHEDIPVTVGLVIDHSGSMRHKIAEVIAAARTFIQSSNPEDQMFVVNFNENVTFGLPNSVLLSSRSEELARAISNTPTAGRTALYDAIIQARKRLQTGGRDKKVLIVISDGGDNASTHTLAEVLKMAQLSSTLVYAIGIFDESDPDRNPGVLRRLAGATGGEAFFPAQLHDVLAICERIARDIRNQYTIGYVSSNEARSGTYRTIRVTARSNGKGKLSVHTRAGYTVGEHTK